MQHHALLPIVRETLRYKICRVCGQRPAGSEDLGPLVARSCEGTCPVFEHINELVGIAASTRGQRVVPTDQLVADRVCDHCDLSATSGDYCARRLERSCPLTIHGLSIIEAMESLLAQHARARHTQTLQPQAK